MGGGGREVLLNDQNKRVVSDVCEFCYGYVQWIHMCEDRLSDVLSIQFV